MFSCCSGLNDVTHISLCFDDSIVCKPSLKLWYLFLLLFFSFDTYITTVLCWKLLWTIHDIPVSSWKHWFLYDVIVCLKIWVGAGGGLKAVSVSVWKSRSKWCQKCGSAEWSVFSIWLIWLIVWASALCTFYNNPAPLNGSMQFHYCTLVTREPEQMTLLFWSAACGVTPHGLHTADRQ